MNFENLVIAAKRGERKAEVALYEALSGYCMVVCLRYLKVYEDAEEAMHDGFIRFIKGIAGFNFQGDQELKSFLARIMGQCCASRSRKKEPNVLYVPDFDEDEAIDDDAFDKIEAAEILRSIIDLPEIYRFVFNLYVFEGYDHKEIAGFLNIQETASRARLRRARIMLQYSITVKHKLNENTGR